MDYEIGFKILVGVVFGWFTVDRRNLREDIKELQKKASTSAVDVARLQENVASIKDDTKYIREHVEK